MRNLKLETRNWRVTPNAQRFGAANVSPVGTEQQTTRLGVSQEIAGKTQRIHQNNNETSSEHPVFCRGGSVCGITSFQFPVSSFQSSFTLIELIVTIAISGIVMLTLTVGFHEAVRMMAPQKAARSATVLAEDMMNEIRSKKYVDPQSPTNDLGPDLGETYRLQYDDVDDYHGWTGSPPETIEGSVMTNYSGFQRSVTVDYVSTADLDTPTNATTTLKRIKIVVSSSEVAVTNVSVVCEYD